MSQEYKPWYPGRYLSNGFHLLSKMWDFADLELKVQLPLFREN